MVATGRLLISKSTVVVTAAGLPAASVALTSSCSGPSGSPASAPAGSVALHVPSALTKPAKVRPPTEISSTVPAARWVAVPLSNCAAAASPALNRPSINGVLMVSSGSALIATSKSTSSVVVLPALSVTDTPTSSVPSFSSSKSPAGIVRLQSPLLSAVAVYCLLFSVTVTVNPASVEPLTSSPASASARLRIPSSPTSSVISSNGASLSTIKSWLASARLPAISSPLAVTVLLP